MAVLTRILPTRLLGSAAFGAAARRVFPWSDAALHRATRGRATLTAALGLPVLLLETTGRRTGERRIAPLLYAAQTADSGVDSFLLAGTNWGQRHQPGWALNLVAAPQAAVSLRGQSFPVTARVLGGQERAEAWLLLLKVWPAYDEYARRVSASSGREIMVFRLERA
jgi:deazaflavin-dependent oxidoreductase (nitroreductase family)